MSPHPIRVESEPDEDNPVRTWHVTWDSPTGRRLCSPSFTRIEAALALAERKAGQNPEVVQRSVAGFL